MKIEKTNGLVEIVLKPDEALIVASAISRVRGNGNIPGPIDALLEQFFNGIVQSTKADLMEMIDRSTSPCTDPNCACKRRDD